MSLDKLREKIKRINLSHRGQHNRIVEVLKEIVDLLEPLTTQTTQDEQELERSKTAIKNALEAIKKEKEVKNEQLGSVLLKDLHGSSDKKPVPESKDRSDTGKGQVDSSDGV